MLIFSNVYSISFLLCILWISFLFLRKKKTVKENEKLNTHINFHRNIYRTKVVTFTIAFTYILLFIFPNNSRTLNRGINFPFPFLLLRQKWKKIHQRWSMRASKTWKGCWNFNSNFLLSFSFPQFSFSFSFLCC